MGGAATDAHFEVTLKCKKDFLVIFLTDWYIDVVQIFTKCLHIKKQWLHFAGGTAMHAQFEVALKCKKDFLVRFI